MPLLPPDPADAAALAVALTPGRRRYHRQLLEVDWDRDGTYGNVVSNVTRAVSRTPGVQKRWELSDSAPGSAAVASGASAAQLTATLDGSLIVAGRAVPATELFSPYNPAGPLYGQRIKGVGIRWSVGTRTTRGWVWQRQFTGQLDERRVTAAGAVKITAFDSIGNLLAPAFWPPWAVDAVAAARAGGTDSLASQRGLASSIVDYVLNAAGRRTRPRPPWESHDDVLALFWLPLCGSFAPAAGKMQAKYPWGTSADLFPEKWTQAPAARLDGQYWTDGPFGLARDVQPGVYPGSMLYMARDTLPIWSGRSTGVSAWIYCGPNAPGYDVSPSSALRPPIVQVYYGYQIFSSNYWATRLGIASDGKTVQIQVEPGQDRIYRVGYTPGTTAWRHIYARLDHTSGAVLAKLFVDGVEQASFVPTGTSNSQVGTPLNSLFMPELGCRLQPCVRVSDAMAWQEVGAPVATPERTVYGGVRATVDRSLNELSYLPSPDPETTHRQILQAVTSAEYASLYADEDDMIHWMNRENVRGDGSPVYTITRSAAVAAGTLESTTAIANAAQCSARAGSATWQTAWELPAVDLIHAPVGTSTWTFTTSDDVVAVEHGAVPRLYQSASSASTVPVWGASVVGGYIFIYDGGETEELANQAMIDPVNQTGFNDRQMIRLVVSNTGSAAGRFRFKSDATAGTDPRPALRIAGYVLVRESAQYATELRSAAIADAGEQITINVGGSDWHQHLPSVQRSARFMLRRASQLIPVFDRIKLPGDTRRQITDSGILELGTTGPRVRTYIAGITRTFANDGLVDDIQFRATHAPDRWAIGDPELGVIGTAKV